MDGMQERKTSRLLVSVVSRFFSRLTKTNQSDAIGDKLSELARLLLWSMT